ncbi:thiol reductant ABC exporter subunit CydC [Cohnella sp. GbtcB17]|uniref:thiol reductant ABC exporter subunit CydC n=1 Tax=Cohnella sp. GbtcB17 TaxID=2824762 RepID=UPI001C2F536F|nr:thiol reductant ABC exporter subunit CydC [Cohnella sp. GbtcB17]
MSELAILSQAMIRERKDILLSIVGGFVAGIAGVVLFSASGYLISQTVFAPPLYTLIVLTSLVKLLGLLRAASRYGERLYSHRATFSMLSRVRASFFSKLIPLTPGILNRNRSGDLLARIVGDVEGLQHYFLRVAYPPIIVVMVFLSTMLAAASFSVWIACLLLLGMLATVFVVPGIVLLGYRGVNGQVRKQRASLSAEITEVLYGYRELKLYGQLAQRERQLRQASGALAAAQRRAAGQLLRGQSLHAFVTYLICWGVLALGAYLIAHGTMAGVYLAMLVMAALTVFEEAAAMATLPAYKQDSEHAAKRLTEAVLTPPLQPESPVQPSRALNTDDALSIEISGVSFQYEGEWRPALNHFSLQMPPGSRTAIVGPSSCGKSTLIELLLKLRTPTAGDLRLGGISVDELEASSIWNTAHVVLQQSHFFRGTIRDNLLIDGEDHTDDDLLNILAKVQLPTASLSDPVYEKGENLSDGEKQRLALARAMLRKGKLWLLDEPTSSMDYVTERRVMTHLYEQASEDTLLLICHRLNGLEDFDRIVVVEQGSVIESGSYSALMEQKGYFYRMKQFEQQLMNSLPH